MAKSPIIIRGGSVTVDINSSDYPRENSTSNKHTGTGLFISRITVTDDNNSQDHLCPLPETVPYNVQVQTIRSGQPDQPITIENLGTAIEMVFDHAEYPESTHSHGDRKIDTLTIRDGNEVTHSCTAIPANGLCTITIEVDE